jgi:hypothetical protein
MYKDERRMFERFGVGFSAAIKQLQIQKINQAQCCDISATGVGLFTEQKLIPNTKLEIWLDIPQQDRPFHGLLRVIWSEKVQENKFHSGLEFETADFMGLRNIFASINAL